MTGINIRFIIGFGMTSLWMTLAGVAAEDPLAQGFVNPPDEVRPATFGFIMPGGAIPNKVITRDLEEMKTKGISTCLLYTPGRNAEKVKRGRKLIYGETGHQVVKTDEYNGAGVIHVELPWSNIPWSPDWVRSVRWAAREAGRVGIELGVCVGGISCELFNLPLEYGEQTLVYTSKAVPADAHVDEIIPLAGNVFLAKDGTPKFYRDIALLAVPANGDIAPAQVVDVSSHMDASGRLIWDAPALAAGATSGWMILRFGHTVLSMGCIDHLSAEALEKKWAVEMGKMLVEMTPEERKGVAFVECDSYEGRAQTWTARFAAEFLKRRGYALKSWLPVLAGRVIGDKRQSACFKRDYELTIKDLIADNHYARHRDLAHANGLKFYAEASGPHQHQSDRLKSLSRCDVPMGEFWMPGSHRGVGDSKRFLLRDAAAAAHAYGMKDVFCEAFTGGNDPWRETPFHLKQCADQAYCDGLTRPCIHGYNISPWPDAAPGIVYWAGTYLNRYTTWWEQSPAFFTYLARCSYMLRQGLFAADVAIYDGDQSNSWPRKAAQNLMEGLHDYDRVNSDVILTRMSFKDGRIILPDGMNYQMLVMGKSGPVTVELMRKLVSLVEAGATILGNRPTEPYGLLDDPAEFTALADRLWGQEKKEGADIRQVGKGRVVWGKPVLDYLHENGTQPDFICSGVSTNGVIDWIHRTADWGDIYFVTSRWQPVEQIECSFRVSGRIPELWDPVTGSIREAGGFRQENGRTVLPLRFDPFGSVFVVFRKPTDETARSGKNWRDYKRVVKLVGSWTVGFEPKWGGPAQVVFDQLQDWTQRPEEGIKYYSGKAVYRKIFDFAPVISNNQPRLWLDLGDVRELAEVHLNGKYLGVLWTKPFRVDMTDVIRTGSNHLEVTVVNLWPNRLIGDSFLPEEKRYTRTSMTKYTQKSQLFPSGLLGPVSIQSQTETDGE